MKKLKYINIVFILAMILTAISVNAEEIVDTSVSNDTVTNTQTLDKIKQDRLLKREKMIVNKEYTKERLEEKRENIEYKKEDKKSRLLEKKDTRSEIWKSKAIERMSSGFKRLTTLIERLESRIAKVDEAGGNTARAKSSIQNAKDKINITKQKIEEVKVIYPENYEDGEEDLGQNELVQKVLPVAKEVKELLKSAHQDLVNAVKFLKEDNRKEKLDTDSSQSTNNMGSDENEQNQ